MLFTHLIRFLGTSRIYIARHAHRKHIWVPAGEFLRAFLRLASHALQRAKVLAKAVAGAGFHNFSFVGTRKGHKGTKRDKKGRNEKQLDTKGAQTRKQMHTDRTRRDNKGQRDTKGKHRKEEMRQQRRKGGTRDKKGQRGRTRETHGHEGGTKEKARTQKGHKGTIRDKK